MSLLFLFLMLPLTLFGQETRSLRDFKAPEQSHGEMIISHKKPTQAEMAQIIKSSKDLSPKRKAELLKKLPNDPIVQEQPSKVMVTKNLQGFKVPEQSHGEMIITHKKQTQAEMAQIIKSNKDLSYKKKAELLEMLTNAPEVQDQPARVMATKNLKDFKAPEQSHGEMIITHKKPSKAEMVQIIENNEDLSPENKAKILEVLNETKKNNDEIDPFLAGCLPSNGAQTISCPHGEYKKDAGVSTITEIKEHLSNGNGKTKKSKSSNSSARHE